ncbi:hypothetical protein [Actinoalloteichus spitiensis]|uniref:hypothetical protein n=1 Tax=Actinoalloteichus spitiensis TaxID=252394 RepID=UPI000370BC21|nr:hypothetical protein [Actinoalloteichus spitiensis]
MAALSEVVERLRGVMDRLPSGAVKEARTRVSDRVTPAFAELTKGTANRDLLTARVALRSVARGLERVDELVEAALVRTREWLAEHGEQAESPLTRRTSTSPPKRVDDVAARVSRYRAKLDDP